jgi:hypothetical protein
MWLRLLADRHNKRKARFGRFRFYLSKSVASAGAQARNPIKQFLARRYGSTRKGTLLESVPLGCYHLDRSAGRAGGHSRRVWPVSLRS